MLDQLWQELKRRKVIRVAAVYVVVAAAIMELASNMMPALRLPDWSVTLVAVLLIVGLPLCVIIAWAYETGPEVAADAVAGEAGEGGTTGRGGDFWGLALSVLMLAIIGISVFRYWEYRSGGLAEGEAAGQELSVAVLPFADFSAEGDQEYFADGVAEEILNVLAKTEGLKVAARTSSFQFKGKNKDVSEIGRTLNVDAVLEGSVRKSGNRIRVTAQLIDTKDGYHIWSKTFEREIDDIFAIQDEISLAIATELKGDEAEEPVRYARAGGTADLEAYQAYLKGVYHRGRRTAPDLRRAAELFHESIQLDPYYASAYGGLARTMFLGEGYRAFPQEQAFGEGRTAALRALELDPDNSEARAALAGIQAWGDWEFLEAQATFERALEDNPNDAEAYHWYSMLLGWMGKEEEADRASERAYELDPLAIPIALKKAWHYFKQDKPEEGMAQLEDLISRNPGNTTLMGTKSAMLSELKRFDEAEEIIETAFDDTPEDVAEVWMHRGWLALKQEDEAAGEEALKNLLALRKEHPHLVSNLLLARFYYELGDEETALAYLKAADAARENNIFEMMYDKDARPILSELPNLMTAIRKAGLELPKLGEPEG
ncbi:MAG: hypothetical protein MI755_18785 [Sphingomonadales bacterium]|nr:hypothetical protein [Sphingomonadales bacterium]